MGTTLLAHRLIIFFFSSEYTNSIPALRILIWALVFGFFNLQLRFVIYSANKQKFVLLTSGGMVALNVLLNLWLIPKYGYIAACYTTLLTEAVGFCINYIFVHKFIARVEATLPILKSVAASLVMVMLIFLLPGANLAFLIVTGAAVYTGFLVLSGAVDAEDRRILISVFTARN